MSEYLENVNIYSLWGEEPPNRIEFEMLPDVEGVVTLIERLTNLNNSDIKKIFIDTYLPGQEFKDQKSFIEDLKLEFKQRLDQEEGSILISFPAIYPTDPISREHIVDLYIYRNPHARPLPDTFKVIINAHAITDIISLKVIADIRSMIEDKALKDHALMGKR